VAAEAKKTRAIDPQAVVESLFIYARSPQTRARGCGYVALNTKKRCLE